MQIVAQKLTFICCKNAKYLSYFIMLVRTLIHHADLIPHCRDHFVRNTNATTAPQRVPLLRRRHPASDSVSNHPCGSVTQQQGRLAGISAWHLLLELRADLYMVHVAPPFR